MGKRRGKIFFLLITLAGAGITLAQTDPAPAPSANDATSAPAALPANPAIEPPAASSAAALPSTATPLSAPAPAAVSAAPPLKPKEFVEPPPPAPGNCPAIAAAVYGAAGEIRDADFFPDEQRIVYISTKSGGPQLYLQDLNPPASVGKVTPAGKLPPARALPKIALDLRGVRVYPDGNALLLSVRLRGGLRSFYKWTITAGGGKPAPLPRGAGESQKFLAWGKRGELWFSATDRAGRAHLRTLAEEGKTAVELFAGEPGDEIGALSSDFKWVAMALEDGTGNPGNIILINLTTNRRTVLTSPGSISLRPRVLLGFSPDNLTLRLLGETGGNKLALYELPIDGHPPRLLAQRDEDILQAGSLGTSDWVVELSGGRPLMSLSRSSTDIPLKVAPPGSGGFLPLRISATGDKALLRAEGEGQPGDLWLCTDPDHEPLRLTELRNPAISAGCDAAAKSVLPRPVDAELKGWLYEPKKIRAGMILLPDAPGPGFRPQFDGRINYFVSRGFLVLALNRRGTDCGGASWDLENGFASDAGLQEVAAARKYLLDAGVPENRVVLWGEGTGGTLALRATQSTPADYAAGVIIGAPVDLAAWRAELPAGSLRGRLIKAQEESGATPPQSLLNGSFEKSPPLIILHGADDDIVPVSQAEALAEALLASGRIVAFHVFEGAGHELDRPADRANALSSAGKFLLRHVLMKAAPKNIVMREIFSSAPAGVE